MSKVREARERLGRAAIMSPDHACMLLPMPKSLARMWLLDQGLIVEVAGTPTVCWGDVLDARERASSRLTATRRFRRERL